MLASYGSLRDSFLYRDGILADLLATKHTPHLFFHNLDFFFSFVFHSASCVLRSSTPDEVHVLYRVYLPDHTSPGRKAPARSQRQFEIVGQRHRVNGNGRPR
jgi:hypothetical protein